MFKKILIPLDGSKLAEAALPSATALAQPSGQLVLVRVMPDLWIDEALTPQQMEEFTDRLKHECQHYLDGVAEGLRKQGYGVDVLVASGDPAGQILQVADLAHSDLIAMSTHGHSGLQRLMLGSVADKVVQHAKVPVLLVRPPAGLNEPQSIDIARPLTITTSEGLAEPRRFDAKVTPWQVVSETMPDGDESARLRHLLRYAILAPSTHNTQPWRFVVDRNEIRIYADRSRRLKIADADERELHVSLGCALENLLVAAEHYHYTHSVMLLPEADQRDLVAVVQLASGGVPAPQRAGLFDSIPQRFTDHGIYNGSAINPSLLMLLQNVCAEPNLKPMLIADETMRHQIDQLVARADAVQFADPAFRQELGQTIGQGAYGNSWLLSKLEQMAVTLINLGDSTARNDTKSLTSAPIFGVITSEVDDRKSQVQAGQLYERMHLLAIRLHLSMQPMNQLLQQRYFKSALTDILFADRLKVTYVGSHQPAAASPTPQMAFRLGYGEFKAEHTPRRPLEDVLN